MASSSELKLSLQMETFPPGRGQGSSWDSEGKQKVTGLGKQNLKGSWGLLPSRGWGCRGGPALRQTEDAAICRLPASWAEGSAVSPRLRHRGSGLFQEAAALESPPLL